MYVIAVPAGKAILGEENGLGWVMRHDENMLQWVGVCVCVCVCACTPPTHTHSLMVKGNHYQGNLGA